MSLEPLEVFSNAFKFQSIGSRIRRPLTFSEREKKMEVVNRNLIGLEEAKLALQESILLPRMLPPRVREAIFRGIRKLPTTVLLHGPPGTGKTSLVYSMAEAANYKVFSVKPSQVLSKWAGEGEKQLRQIFSDAHEAASSASSGVLLQSTPMTNADAPTPAAVREDASKAVRQSAAVTFPTWCAKR